MAQERLAALAKPLGSLGVLEDWAATLCTVQQTLKPTADPAAVVIFCADHGCKKADEALSPYPPVVTQAIFRSLAAGISGTAVLTRSAGASLTVVDVGIDGDMLQVEGATETIRVSHAKISRGTADSRIGPAMSEESVAAAIDVGRSALAAEAARGMRVVCVGEIGIGNTTSAAAMLAALTGADANECCGRGTGLNDDGLAHKVQAVRAALATHEHATAHASDLEDSAARQRAAREVLRCVGGLELAAMTGAYLEAHKLRLVAVVDGFISAVAALCAARMEPASREVMLFATALAEEPLAGRGGEVLEGALGATPALHMKLRLGEGSGAALALPLVRAAAAMVGEMGTLDEAMALMPPPP